ncbi:villin-1 isoform X1 [Typha latifolia]|uniref:villin-1 isoform X1 n=1 Tax=Typha latifolia TaxID=4733 RepID=UPI003C30D037
MSMSTKVVDEAFRGVGDKSGLEVWCIVNLHLVPIPKSSHGKFFSGNTYIILNTVVLKNGLHHHDLHYWMEKDAKEVACTMASDKAIELDAALGSRAVQYREVQGSETDKFLSYFKPCIIPIDGHFSSHLQAMGGQPYQITLFSCKGDHFVHVREVPFSRSTLNHNNVFVLDTNSKIFLFSGCNSSTQERARALEVVQYIKENQHGGRCEVATIDDGKLVGDSDAGEFWNLFGGYAPISRDPPSTTQAEANNISSRKLFWINKGKLFPVETPSLDKAILSSDNCYMLDCGAEIFVWMGKTTLISERKTNVSAIEDYMHSQGRTTSTHTTFLTEGSEIAKFKSYFNGWPQNLSPNLYVQGRGKVAAIFKHQDYDIKELPEDKTELLIDCNGTLKVWLVDSGSGLLLSTIEQNKLYSGDCYIVQYSYRGSKRDHHLFYAWFGKRSILEDRKDAVSIMTSMVDSVKGYPVMAQVFEGREPDLFFTVFKSLIIFKGGMGTAYKKSMSHKRVKDEDCKKDKAALFRVQGSGNHTVQAIQVDSVSTSLNSSQCYILQDGDLFFTWTGNLSSRSDHDLLDMMLDWLSPLKQSISIREGSESDHFWNILGGKSEYPREKHNRGCTEGPHLFTCVFKEGSYKGKEIFNFTQDDLTTEDALILDCGNEVYVWVGLHANITSNEQAFDLGKKFLEADILLEGRSMNTATYVITEGNEPSFFTCFFSWDTAKAYMHGNSFERKLAFLKGSSAKMETPDKGLRKSFRRYSSESTADHSIRKTVYSKGLHEREGLAACTVSPDFGSPKSHLLSIPTAVAKQIFPASSSHPTHAVSPKLHVTNFHLSLDSLAKDGSTESLSVAQELDPNLRNLEKVTVVDHEENADTGWKFFSYEQLKVPS